ncbi:MAG: GMC family oxidoreductase [Bauldia sp.]|nr:GMC family oxidoreductase [Bauldia sp.]
MVSVNKGSKVAEVLIVGAGPSGLVAAKHLTQSGFDVVCLEQGERVDHGSYWGDKPEFELMIQKRWHPNPNVRDLESDYPVNTSESDVPILMYNAVGGTSIVYGAHWQRFMPSDFRVQTLDGVADDWPFTYEDLAPYYDEMEAEIGVSGLGGDPALPAGKGPPLPALPIGRMGRKAAEGMNKLGWHWWPAPNSIASRSFEGRNPCALRGTCRNGCVEGAKATFDVTHLPAALKHGLRLVAGARVREILVNDQGLATGAVYIDRNGRERRQLARAVIVCCNGVGTPRLLLNSKSSLFPDGLANSSGLVGRNLMLHPYSTVVGHFDDWLESWLGPAGQPIQSMQFYETDTSRGFVRGAKWHVLPGGGPLGGPPAPGRPFDEAWGPAFHQNRDRIFGRSFEWGIMAEDLPEEANRVVLDPELADSDGIPAAKIIYDYSENTKRLSEFHLARAKEAMEAAGATSVTVRGLMTDRSEHNTGASLRATGHLMGTCKMGNDPRTSVVNQWGRSHDVPNLFVYDGSVFVTSAGFNPTGTICAVALRSVKHLIADRRNMKVAA